MRRENDIPEKHFFPGECQRREKRKCGICTSFHSNSWNGVDTRNSSRPLVSYSVCSCGWPLCLVPPPSIPPSSIRTKPLLIDRNQTLRGSLLPLLNEHLLTAKRPEWKGEGATISINKREKRGRNRPDCLRGMIDKKCSQRSCTVFLMMTSTEFL